MTWQVEIRRFADGGVEKTLGPYATEREADKVDDGLNRNLNHQAFYTVIALPQPPEVTP